MKKITGVFLAFVMLLGSLSASVLAKETIWSEKYENYWNDELEDDKIDLAKVDLEGLCTRADTAKLLATILKLSPISEEPAFSDVPVSDENYAYIQACADNGIFKGYGDGTFRPSESISRQETMAVICRVTNLEPDAQAAVQYTDSAEISDWALGYLGALTKAGIVNGYPGGEDGAYVNPGGVVNFGELYKMLYTADTSSSCDWTQGSREKGVPLPDEPVDPDDPVNPDTPQDDDDSTYYKISLTVTDKNDTAKTVSADSSSYLIRTTVAVPEIIQLLIANKDDFKAQFDDDALRGLMNGCTDAYDAGADAWSAWVEGTLGTFDATSERGLSIEKLISCLSDTSTKIGAIGTGRWSLEYSTAGGEYIVNIAIVNT